MAVELDDLLALEVDRPLSGPDAAAGGLDRADERLEGGPHRADRRPLGVVAALAAQPWVDGSSAVADAGPTGSGLSPASSTTPETHSIVATSHDRSGSSSPLTGSCHRMSRIWPTMCLQFLAGQFGWLLHRCSSIVLGQEDRGHGTVGLGDDPEPAVAPP